MVKQFETFRLFQDEAIALDIGQILTQAGIPCKIASSPKLLDSQILGTDSTPDYALNLSPDNFEEANKILNNYFEKKILDTDSDYFIYSFSQEELKDVIKKPDEWGEYNYQLAKKILKEKGVTITDDTLKSFEVERKNELSKTESPAIFLYVAAIIIIINALVLLPAKTGISLITPFFSIFGYFIGKHIRNYKKVLPNGQLINFYHQKDRKNGSTIEMISFVLVLLSAIKFLLFILGYFPDSLFE